MADTLQVDVEGEAVRPALRQTTEEWMDSADGNGLAYDLHREGGHAVVALRGELDMASAPELEACLQRLRANRVLHVTVDLAGLDFCDSSGLATFLRFRRDAERGGSSLVLRSPRANVRRLLELTGADALLLDDGRPTTSCARGPS